MASEPLVSAANTPAEDSPQVAAAVDAQHVLADSAESGIGNAEAQAATVIQKNYRGYRDRRQLKGIGLDASQRWTEALKEVQYRRRTRPLTPNVPLSTAQSHARERWKLASEAALRAGSDDTSETSGEEGMSPEEYEAYKHKKLLAKREREKTAKMMDLQYFLEMVDTKHRYGSNLRAYHAEWKRSDTHENFFYWLDEGAGANIEVPTVSRERLNNEQVRYLSREERQNYLVRVDSEGRLCWAKNGERLTTSVDFKDSIEGVVPKDSKTPTWSSTATNDRPVTSSSTSSSDRSILSAGSVDEAEGEHYVNHDLDNAKGLKKIKHVSAATVLNHLLQKSIRPNSWIFVADTSFRLYVGIKKSGAFQHSSFLHGARISAAGLIKIKDGQLRRLSPLSGHYRPPTKNFRLFVHSLRDAGVDMSHVSISRSYAVLVGLEAYVRTRKNIKHGIEHVKDEGEKILHPEEAKRKAEEMIDNSKSAQREREILEEQKRHAEHQKKSMTLAQRLRKKLQFRKGDIKWTGTGRTAKILSTEGEDIESAIPPDGTRS